MTSLGVLSNLLTTLRTGVVTCSRHKRLSVSRKVYGAYENIEQYESELEAKKLKKAKAKQPEQQKKEKPPIATSLLDLRYENLGKDSRNKFSNMMCNVKTSRYRSTHKVCALHGKSLIREAMRSGSYVRCVYFSRFEHLEGLPIDVLRKTNLFMVSQRVLDEFSSKNVEGVYALMTQQDEVTRKKIVDKRAENKEAIYLPLTIICTGILDARTMGCVLGVANVTGCKEVYVMDGCVDIWNMEVLKTGNGAHFNIPVHSSMDWEKMEKIAKIQKPDNLFIASNNLDGISLQDVTSESQYEDIVERTSLYRDIVGDANENTDDADIVSGKIPSIPYHEMALSPKSNIIVIGRIDRDGYNFCITQRSLGTQCKAVTLPMTSPTDKPSVMTSASVLLFDSRRQILAQKLKTE